MSSSLTSSPGRPAESANRIADDLRAQIVEGHLGPGVQIPTRAEIERKFGAGPATVQRALEMLRRDGFVQVNGKQGTYVADNPPHLSRYAIVFPTLPTERAWNKFWTALRDQVITLERLQTRPQELELPIYYGVGRKSESADFLKLEKEVKSHCLAGIIFMSSTFNIADSAVMKTTGIPRVIISGGPEGDIPLVQLNGMGFRERAVDYLISKGRRKIAVISPPMGPATREHWLKAFEDRGLRLPPQWFHWIQQTTADAARNLTHLLMDSANTDRPDGLIIADDHLVDFSLGGLLAAGAKVPDDVEVVAHCNFPWHDPSVLPVKRLGFDARQVIAACVDIIDRQRAGEKVPEVTQIPALFGEEVPETRTMNELVEETK